MSFFWRKLILFCFNSLPGFLGVIGFRCLNSICSKLTAAKRRNNCRGQRMSSTRTSLLSTHQIAEDSATETADKKSGAKSEDCEIALAKNPFSPSGSMTDRRSATQHRYSAFTRDSILSDPRLSQVHMLNISS